MIKEAKYKTVNIKDLKPAKYNPRKITDRTLNDLEHSLKEWGLVQPLVINKDGTVIGGHQRLRLLKKQGVDKVTVAELDLNEDAEKALNIALNRVQGTFDEQGLLALLNDLQKNEKLAGTGYNEKELARLQWKNNNQINRTLIEDYIIPPFSIWDAKQGYWTKRKQEWHEQLGDTLAGRDGDIDEQGSTPGSIGGDNLKAISQYDPVMIEVLLTWYAQPGDYVLDPFSGSPLAGLIASRLGYNFIGTDTWKDQVLRNKGRADALEESKCTWYHDTGANIAKYLPKGKKAKLLITDPPYFNLENYQSTNENDISNATDYKHFIKLLTEVLKPTYDALEDNGWAVIKIGNVRDKNGNYYNLVGDTVRLMEEIGYHFYNEVILATPIASAPVRARNTFDTNKKVVKTHQNILFFGKGKETSINGTLKDIISSGVTATAHHDVLIFKK